MSYEGVLEQSGSGLKKLVEDGEEIIGYIYPHTPLELILAHGLTPSLMRALPGVASGFEESLQTFACSYIRNLYNQRVNELLPPTTGLLFPGNTCDSLQNLTDIWKVRFSNDNIYRLTYPVTRYANDGSAEIYLGKELELLSKKFELTLNRPFSTDNYERAVSLIRGFRLDAQFLYAARVVDPEVLPYAELVRLVRSFLTTPVESVASEIHRVSLSVKEKMEAKGLIDIIDSILSGFQKKDLSKVEPFKPPAGSRILVVGGMVEPQAIATIINGIDGIDDSILILDLLSFGFKSVFAPPLDKNGAPFEEMAKSILAAPGEPTQEGLHHRMDFLKNLVEALHIDGLIICEQSFCDPDQFEAPSIEKAASKSGIRTVRIPLDPELSDRARIEVKIHTFLESLGNT
ncbi:MAG: 2-hydroxyacyl-CoA dehydratase family protein [Candidatus Thorarchaeota archaeon]|nr:2-hydroxyacyl-CoA dehydratase family protein [Candidatus Thorarchaeota archaeon]